MGGVRCGSSADATGGGAATVGGGAAATLAELEVTVEEADDAVAVLPCFEVHMTTPPAIAARAAALAQRALRRLRRARVISVRRSTAGDIAPRGGIEMAADETLELIP